jgi:cyclic lactone autoinducer peptide
MKRWNKFFSKALFVSLVASVATFFAQTSTYATTIWIFDQPKVPRKLLKK